MLSSPLIAPPLVSATTEPRSISSSTLGSPFRSMTLLLFNNRENSRQLKVAALRFIMGRIYRDKSARYSAEDGGEIGRAHVGTPVTNSPLVCLLLIEKKKNH